MMLRMKTGAMLIAVLGLLLTGCGDAAKTAGTAVQNEPATVFKWKLVTTWPKNYPGLGLGPENFAKLVERMSNGRMQVKVYGGNELVPPFEVFDAVSRGTAEMGHWGAYYWKGKSPATTFFSTLPFGMTAQETNAWLHYGGGMELWRELYARFNLVPLAGGNTGVQMAGWFNKEIKTPDDLKGLKMRSTDGGVSWQPSPGIRASTVRALTLDRQNPERLFALRPYTGSYPTVILGSLNRGASWDRLVLSPELGDSVLADFTVDPNDPHHYLVATDSRYGRGFRGVVSSLDAGATWTAPG